MEIPFSPPYIDDDIIREVVDTLKSGWITTGPKVRALEQEVVKMTGCFEALGVNSWTSGALLVLKWFGVGPGDEVIVPAYTYSATALSVLQCGATPIMVDVKEDFTVDPDKVREAITSATKVIMPVDFAGLTCNYDELNSLAADPKIVSQFKPTSEKQFQLGRILVVADAAHSIGALFNGKKSGFLTDITIFSFHAVKNITTAEGGAICLNLPSEFDNSAEYQLMRMWSLNGQTKDAFSKSKSGGWKYDILFAGLKVNMPDLCAAVGLAQLKKYDLTLLKERKRIAKEYEEFFSKKNWAQLPVLEDEKRESCYHLYPLRIKAIDEAIRDKIIEEVTALKVAVNVHFVPMPMLTLFKSLNYSISDYPMSYSNYSREISLPIYPQLDSSTVARVCMAIEKSYLKVVKNDETA